VGYDYSFFSFYIESYNCVQELMLLYFLNELANSNSASFNPRSIFQYKLITNYTNTYMQVSVLLIYF